ncbi:DNA polymerase III subunit alpha [Candidatus Providencia siddallii]|uniref:DNA polymerase III subunit alpha n=1 Tax=Candidatus Providencia siddallii TaxID=1715285 RepID=A0A0M6W7J0_9GAMM|nr:DNA polymerase III subunit alpha [Candidatus Providencia siddallii]
MTQPNFIHLRVHTDYSMINGLIKIETLIKKISDMKMPSIAITDFTNFFGLIKFYDATHKAGIKPIIGADFYVENDIFCNSISHLTVLARNNEGYKNMNLLISKAYQKGYKAIGPTIQRDWLIEHKDGLILLSGGRKGDIGQSLLHKNYDLTNKCVEFYKQYFPDYYYLELIRTGRDNEEKYLYEAIKLASKKKIPVVATNEVCFFNKEDFDAHEIRVAIHDGFVLNNPKRPKNYSPYQYLRSEKEMCDLFSDIPEALINSVEISKRCNVTIHLGKHFLPQFPTGDVKTETFLILQSKKGLEDRLRSIYPDENIRVKKRFKYDNRLNSELKVINEMGFPGYFLIVMEFIQWSKDNKIPVGPGRGSGAGSLVAYALKITDLDPLEFNLIFERFLNPERISMPDFDVDFCTEKRDKVIEHVSNMYGRNAVSQIITFGTMAAKAAIRDVGRVLGYPYGFVNQISKLIPTDPGITLDEAFKNKLELIKIYKNNEEVKEIINMARKLEGTIRNVGKHSGGIIIAPTKIIDFSPLHYDSKGNNPVTQFDKNDIEYVGLIKFDFLGLRTLTVIDLALDMINTSRIKNKLKSINIKTIPLNDKKSFNKLRSSETTGIFQLESNGMKDLIKRLKPDCFEDIIALVALFRPGPLQSGMVDNFINRKRGYEEIFYPDKKWQHKLLKPVLESTYGIILYQEQVIQIAQVIAGYTSGEADILRRAMSKKKPEEMSKQRYIFKKGAIKNKINEELSMKLFDLVEKFAGYGFNKSHSAAYALISYQTIWLKTHYPAEFMAALMTADIDNTDKIIILIDECLRIGLKILPPDINNGFYNFSVNKNNEIIYGIGAIKGIGKTHVYEIIKNRQQNGVFKGIFDFCKRIDIKKINSKIIEKLIMAGVFDSFCIHRAALILSLNYALKIKKQYNQTIMQSDMFGINTLISKYNTEITNTPKLSNKIILDKEKEVLGFYLTGHPITEYLNKIKFYTNGFKIKNINKTHYGKIVTIAGLIIFVKITSIKNGNKICICKLDDNSGRLDLILFPDVFNTYIKLLKKDSIIIATGRITIDNFNGNNKMITNKITEIKK